MNKIMENVSSYDFIDENTCGKFVKWLISFLNVSERFGESKFLRR